MVRLYEHQGKQILKIVGVPVPEGDVVSTPEEAEKIAEKIGKPVVIKAQIWATGRFKVGGIKFAENPMEARKAAEKLLGAEIKGLIVRKVLVEEKLDIDKEYYAGVIVDDSYKVRAPVVMFSIEGGVDIEEVAKEHPEKLVSVVVPYLEGFKKSDALKLLSKFDIPTFSMDAISTILCNLYDLFKKWDARTAEINPLVLTKDQKIVALDCRVTIDDNSVYRHPEFGIEVPRDMDRPPTELEKIAWKIEEGDYRGTGYFTQLVPKIKEEGYIGFHGIGGGGAMLAADALLRRGFKLANYADTSGDPPASKVYRVIKTILSQPKIEGYVLMGSVIASQEQWHHGHAIVKALKEDLKDKPGFPVLILIAGNKEKETHEISREGLKNLPIKLELYGRDYIYRTDFIADRIEAMVKWYRGMGRLSK